MQLLVGFFVCFLIHMTPAPWLPRCSLKPGLSTETVT